MRHYNPDDPDEYYDDDLEFEEDLCVNCNGSGEGMFDGTSCSRCRGWGVVYRLVECKEDDDL